MATVKMFKGNKTADIFDSPETIAQAQKDGYALVENKTETVKEEPKEEKVVRTRTPRQ